MGRRKAATWPRTASPQPNMNHKTGIRYGVISSLNSIDGEIREMLEQNSEAKLLINLRANVRQHLNEALLPFDMLDSMRDDIIDDAVQTIEDGIQWEDLPEDEVENRAGEYEGVKFEMNDRGYMVIIDSPHYLFCRLCSPCYPNAGNLDELDARNGVKTYAVPQDWLQK